MADDNAPVGSPKWWLTRLDNELAARSADMQRFRDLVDDVHPQVQSAETSAKFARMAGLATTNLTGLAVEATAERMSVEGVRVGDNPDSDKVVWDAWQRCDFDYGSQEAVTAALVCGRSYVSVAPPEGDAPAKLYYEDPRSVVVAYTPQGDRSAAFKVFTDEWTGDTFGTLYLPSAVVRLVRRGQPGVADVRWLARDFGSARATEAVTGNPMGVVPFFELQNRISGATRSEVAPLEIPQQLLNQTVFNIEAIAEYGAFRQKWATGIEIPRDPVTGNPVTPYEAHISKLFVSEEDGAKFGDFNPSDLDPHLSLAREIAAHISRLSRVPITYFLSNVSNLGGDALALLISSLVLKCQRRVKGYEPAFENAVRLMLQTMGDPRANAANIEIKWASMETRSVAQDADAAVKLTAGNVVTPQTAQERYLGMSQTERDRDEAWRAESSATSNLGAILQAAQASPLP